MKRKIAGIMAVAFLTTSFAGAGTVEQSMAAGKAKLSAKKVSVSVGKTKTVTIKNVKAKDIKSLKWKTSNKKIATVKKKSKTKATIKGVKKGKTTVKVTFKAKGKKYKFSVSVTVTAMTSATTKATAKVTAKTTATATAKVTAKATASPTATPKVTEEATATASPTATPEATEEPTATVSPTETPAATEEPTATVSPSESPVPTAVPEYDPEGKDPVQLAALNEIVDAQIAAGAKMNKKYDSEDFRWSEEGILPNPTKSGAPDLCSIHPKIEHKGIWRRRGRKGTAGVGYEKQERKRQHESKNHKKRIVDQCDGLASVLRHAAGHHLRMVHGHGKYCSQQDPGW